MLAELGRRVRRYSFTLCALFALLVVLGTPAARAAAGESGQTTEVGGVQCSAFYHGPDLLTHGYFPVRVELWNHSDAAKVIDIEIGQEWQVVDVLTKRVQLAAGEKLTFEPLLRACAGAQNSYALRFEAGGEEGLLVTGPSEWSMGDEQTVLYCSLSDVAAGSVERWSADWTSAIGSTYHIAAAHFDSLSEQWGAYTCYDVVVLSMDEGLPRPEVMDALFAWCRSGGQLLLAGVEPRTALASRPQELKWLQPAFEQAAPEGPSDSFPSYRCGQGVIVLLAQDALGEEVMEGWDGKTAIGFRREASHNPYRQWTPRVEHADNSRMAAVQNQLEGFGELPLRGLMILLVIFAVVMGPANFLWVKRTRRPTLLLLTVPGISIVTSLALVLFGVFSQGLDVKVATRSFTFLDQLARTATTAEVRRVFAGSSPGAGMRPEHGTMVFPEGRFWSSHFRNTERFTQDLNEGRVLGGDYFPVRTPVAQLILSDGSTRLRLDVSTTGSGVEVSNAFGGEVESLLLRDTDGDYHTLERPLGSGASRRLVPGASLREHGDWRKVLVSFWGSEEARSAELPPGTYLAEVRAEGLRDNCGIEVNEVAGRHVVLGVFADPAGGSR